MMMLPYGSLSFSGFSLNFLTLKLFRHNFDDRSILNEKVVYVIVINDVSLRFLSWYYMSFLIRTDAIQSLMDLFKVKTNIDLRVFS